MSNIKNDALLAPGSITPTTRLVLLDQSGNQINNTSMQNLIDYLTPFLGGGAVGGLAAPSMPASASVLAPINRPDGAMLAYIAPNSPGSPAPTFSIVSYPGLTCRAGSGDIIISDAATFFAALATGADLTLTAANSQGSSSTVVSVAPGPDYDDLDEFAVNAVLDLDMLNNPSITYDPLTNLVTNLEDRSPQNRDATNSQEKIGFVLNSGFGVGKPAMRGTGAAGATSGLFFNQNPIWQGIRVAQFSTTTLNDRMLVYFDKAYNISGSEDARQVPTLVFPKDAITAKPSLVTVIANGASLKYRLNGLEMTPANGGVSPIVLQPYNQPTYPVIGFFLFYANANTGYLMSVSAIGQSRSWKDGAINGDIARIVHYLNAVEA